jgi:hypothetical protein
VISNLLLPPVSYLLFRRLIPVPALALSLVGLILLFPPLRFYTLNWAGSDSVFLVALLACAWLVVKLCRGERGRGIWILFGLLAASLALTRPEGLAYAGVYTLLALSLPVEKGRKILALVALLVPMGLFSVVMQTTFGDPWPRSLHGALGVLNLVANWQVLTDDSNQILASALRLSKEQFLGSWGIFLLLALLGSWPALYHPRRLSLLMAPAWINLLMTLMVHPSVSAAAVWQDFFRHISYPLPLLALAGGLAVQAGLRALPRFSLRAVALPAMIALLTAGVLWNIHLLTKPSLNFGGEAGNLLGARRVNLVDVIAHRFEVPVLGFESREGYYVPATPREFLSRYPDQMDERYGPVDPVRRTSGTPYQTGTLYLFLAALALASLPGARASKDDHPAG